MTLGLRQVRWPLFNHPRFAVTPFARQRRSVPDQCRWPVAGGAPHGGSAAVDLTPFLVYAPLAQAGWLNPLKRPDTVSCGEPLPIEDDV